MRIKNVIRPFVGYQKCNLCLYLTFPLRPHKGKATCQRPIKQDFGPRNGSTQAQIPNQEVAQRAWPRSQNKLYKAAQSKKVLTKIHKAWIPLLKISAQALVDDPSLKSNPILWAKSNFGIVPWPWGSRPSKIAGMTRKRDFMCTVFRKAPGNMVKEIMGRQTRSLQLESIRVETLKLIVKVWRESTIESRDREGFSGEIEGGSRKWLSWAILVYLGTFWRQQLINNNAVLIFKEDQSLNKKTKPKCC